MITAAQLQAATVLLGIDQLRCQAIPTFRPNYSAYRGERNDNSWQCRFAGLTYCGA